MQKAKKITFRLSMPDEDPQVYWPICPTAHTAVNFAKGRRLSKSDLHLLKDMGFEVIVETPIYGRDMYYESVRL